VLTLAVLTFFFAVGGFILLTHEVRDGDHVTLDHKLMLALRHDGAPLGPPGMADVMRDYTALGSASVLTLVCVLVLGYLLLARRGYIAGLLFAAVAGGEALNLGLKNLVDRPRPEMALRLVQVHSASFPSGHAMAASIFYLTVGTLLARFAPRRREKVYVIAATATCTLLVGFSRVYLGVHYPSDVLAGWAAGTGWALLCWAGIGWIERRSAEPGIR
jgi:undecaprenyl-diphosphatase